MNSKFLDELISEETMTKLTDEMLRKKNEYKINKKLKNNFIKILPTAILIVLSIGFINLISYHTDDRKVSNNKSNIFLTETRNDFAAISQDNTIDLPTEPAIEPATDNKLTSGTTGFSFYMPIDTTQSLAADFIQIIEPTIDKPNEFLEKIPPTDSQFSTV